MMFCGYNGQESAFFVGSGKHGMWVGKDGRVEVYQFQHISIHIVTPSISILFCGSVFKPWHFGSNGRFKQAVLI